jgi:hypothetical protein
MCYSVNYTFQTFSRCIDFGVTAPFNLSSRSTKNKLVICGCGCFNDLKLQNPKNCLIAVPAPMLVLSVPVVFVSDLLQQVNA